MNNPEMRCIFLNTSELFFLRFKVNSDQSQQHVDYIVNVFYFFIIRGLYSKLIYL